MDIFPGFTTLEILNKIQNMMAALKCEPEQFQGRIIFMSMFNDIVWRTPGNEDNCMANSLNVATCARRFSLGCWSYVGPGCEKKWYGTRVSKPNGEWNRVAENMMINFAETGHPIFQATSPLEGGELKIKGGGKKPFTTTELKKPLKRFLAQLFLQISSVSTEQSQTCATN